MPRMKDRRNWTHKRPHRTGAYLYQPAPGKDLFLLLVVRLGKNLVTLESQSGNPVATGIPSEKFWGPVSPAHLLHLARADCLRSEKPHETTSPESTEISKSPLISKEKRSWPTWLVPGKLWSGLCSSLSSLRARFSCSTWRNSDTK